jgi:ADP-heptose:LPS heptosyltransferase
MHQLPARVLVDLPNWLGDLVHSLPTVAAIHGANQGGSTVVLVPDAYACLAGLLGVEVLTRPVKAGFGWARRTLRGRFDVVLTARHSTRAKLLIAALDARVKLASCGRGALTLGLSTFTVERSLHQRHDLDAALGRLGVAGGGDAPMRMRLPVGLRRWGVQEGFRLAGEGPTVALLPATRGGNGKQYPAGLFREVARRVAAAGVRVLVIVGPGEEAVARDVAGTSRAAVAPPVWSLDRTAGVLLGCAAAVGNDSGLTHLSALVGCPTVALFGPTDPGRTAPVGGARILQPMPGEQLSDLPPDTVVEAVSGLLNQSSHLVGSEPGSDGGDEGWAGRASPVGAGR